VPSPPRGWHDWHSWKEQSDVTDPNVLALLEAIERHLRVIAERVDPGYEPAPPDSPGIPIDTLFPDRLRVLRNDDDRRR
jgi:hypothetical protein